MTDQNKKMSDHDTMIEFVTKFEDFKDATLRLYNDMRAEERGNDNDQERQLATLETRVIRIERIIDGTNLKEVALQVKSDKEWIHDFKLVWRIIIIIYPLILAAIGMILARGINPLKLFNF